MSAGVHSPKRLAALSAVLLAGLGIGLGASASAGAQRTTTPTTPTTTTTPYGPPYAPQAATRGVNYRDGQSGRYLLDGNWLYEADPNDAGLATGLWRGAGSTLGWTPVTVPNSYNANDLSNASYYGSVGWYRKDFTLQRGAFSRYVPARDRSWIIRFDSVNYNATVWLNGRRIGTHAGVYLPFEFDLRGLRTGVNRLIVRVDDRRTGADLPPGPGGTSTAPGTSGPLWWNYGGLLGDVELRTVQRADIERVEVTPTLPCPSCAATVLEQAIVRNLTGSSETVRLTGTYGSTRMLFGMRRLAPGAVWTAQTSLVISHPRLWAPGSPALYKATLTLSDSNGRRLGGYTTYSGIRRITLTPQGHLELNGRLLDLRGVSIHEQTTGLGAALGPTQFAQLIAWARQLGGTIIRAHYPLSPEIEELADRDGILLWSEIPVYQVKAPYLAQPAWRARAQAMLRNNIQTNADHPSILLWSIGNELPAPATAGEAQWISGATALAHRLDPTRPVALDVSGWPGLGCQAAYAPLDVVGINEYFGWFSAGGGTTDDRDALGPFLDSLHACYPTKALFVTEFGFDANRSGPVEERGTYQFQANSLAYHLGVFATKPYLSGAIYWLLQDFASKPGWGGGNPEPNPPYVQKGLVDLQGNEKPAFLVAQSLFRAVTQIAPISGRRRRVASGR